MNFYDYMDTINVDLEVTRYHNQARWLARFHGTEVRRGFAMLVSEYGLGKTPDEAIADYMEKIRGKKIIINAMSTTRREFVVPETITLP